MDNGPGKPELDEVRRDIETGDVSTVTGGLVTISTSQGWTLVAETEFCPAPSIFSMSGAQDDLLFLAASACAIRETTSNFAFALHARTYPHILAPAVVVVIVVVFFNTATLPGYPAEGTI